MLWCCACVWVNSSAFKRACSRPFEGTLGPFSRRLCKRFLPGFQPGSLSDWPGHLNFSRCAWALAQRAHIPCGGPAWFGCAATFRDGNRMKILLLLLVGYAGAALATPGGLDARGCHQPKNGAHHCHEKRAKSPPKLTPEERRLKRECKGLPNAGACLGHARQ